MSRQIILTLLHQARENTVSEKRAFFQTPNVEDMVVINTVRNVYKKVVHIIKVQKIMVENVILDCIVTENKLSGAL